MRLFKFFALVIFTVLNNSCKYLGSEPPENRYSALTNDKSFKTSSTDDEANIIFNEEAYLLAFPDARKEVMKGKISSFEHYIFYGQYEGRLNYQIYLDLLSDINKGYDEDTYLFVYPDVKAALITHRYGLETGYQHYNGAGKIENRLNNQVYLNARFAIKNGFNEDDYLEAFPDVKKDFLNKLISSGYEEYLKTGINAKCINNSECEIKGIGKLGYIQYIKINHKNHPQTTHTFNFKGSGISYIAEKGPDQGTANIWIDGEFKKTIDLYSPEKRIELVYQTNNLPDKKHFIDIRPLDKNPFSSGYGINILSFSDNYTVYSQTVKNEK